MNTRKKALIMILNELNEGYDYMVEQLYNEIENESLMAYFEKNRLDRDSFVEIILVLLDPQLVTESALRSDDVYTLIISIAKIMQEKNLT